MLKALTYLMWGFLVVLFLIVLVPMAYAAETNTVTSTVVTSVDKTPPSANSPSVVVNNSDICRSGFSGSVQSLRIGISSGQTAVDLNCERIKLARSLYGMGMKVASVALLSQDPRVFDAMWFAGTFPPYKGLIGLDAKAAWEKDVAQIPDGADMKVILRKEQRERLRVKRAAELEDKQREVRRLEEQGRKKAKEFFKKLFNPKK